MNMNLGVIYIRAALLILASGFLLGAIITGVFLFAKRKRVLSRALLLGVVAVGLPLGCVELAILHHPLFRLWHRVQNEVAPTCDCLLYEPSFWHLYAAYKMDQQSFDQWIASHSWKLTQCESDQTFELHDGPYFGLKSCEAVYESPRGPKGNNLRVYYHNGVAYLSYSAM
jgi:hypothetical protein